MSAHTYLVHAYTYDFSNRNILECGSHSSGSETESFRKNNNCFYIEANPTDYNNMLNQHDVTQKNVHNVALYNHNGRIRFTVTSHPGNSSVLHCDSHKKELQGYQSTFIDIDVECITYPHFIRNVIQRPIDVLVLDIEGVECDVLQTMKELTTTELPKFIVIEAGYNWPSRKTLLTELGYTVDFYQYNNAYLTHSTLNVIKNTPFINKTNNENRQFVWGNQVIYVNDLCSE